MESKDNFKISAKLDARKWKMCFCLEYLELIKVFSDAKYIYTVLISHGSYRKENRYNKYQEQDSTEEFIEFTLNECCKKGDHFQGLREGFCLTLGNELSEETPVLIKQETFLGNGAWTESSRGRESRRSTLPCGSQSCILWVMGLVSGLSLGNHSGSESFLAHALFSQDGFHHEGFWEVGGHRDWHLLSAFGLSWIIPVDSS